MPQPARKSAPAPAPTRPGPVQGYATLDARVETPAAASGPQAAPPSGGQQAAKIQAALALGTTVQSDWLACPLGLDGLDLLNRNTLTFTLLTDPQAGRVVFDEYGTPLRISDCVLLYDAGHGRYFSVSLNQPIRAEAGSTLVLPEKTMRAQTGEPVRGATIGWLSGHGAFST